MPPEAGRSGREPCSAGGRRRRGPGGDSAGSCPSRSSCTSARHCSTGRGRRSCCTGPATGGSCTAGSSRPPGGAAAPPPAGGAPAWCAPAVRRPGRVLGRRPDASPSPGQVAAGTDGCPPVHRRRWAAPAPRAAAAGRPAAPEPADPRAAPGGTTARPERSVPRRDPRDVEVPAEVGAGEPRLPGRVDQAAQGPPVTYDQRGSSLDEGLGAVPATDRHRRAQQEPTELVHHIGRPGGHPSTLAQASRSAVVIAWPDCSLRTDTDQGGQSSDGRGDRRRMRDTGRGCRRSSRWSRHVAAGPGPSRQGAGGGHPHDPQRRRALRVGHRIAVAPRESDCW
jgi:hypothetical protein